MTPHDNSMEQDEKECRSREDALMQSDLAQGLDRSKGIVKGVRILNWKSPTHNRLYTREAVEAALNMKHGYNNAVVNLNHGRIDNVAPGSVAHIDVERVFGRIKNARVDDKGVIGDLKYNRKHPWAAAFEDFCEHDPSAIGLSHDAFFRGPVMPDGTHVIKSIDRVYSVDIVAQPGTTSGMYEDATVDPMEESVEDLMPEDSDYATHLGALATEIFKDSSLSCEEKKKKLSALCDIDPSGDEHGDEESEETKETPMKTEGTESAVTYTNDPAILAELTALKSANTELTGKIDALTLANEEFRARESATKDANDAKEACKTAGLDIENKTIVSDTFLKQLVKRGREGWNELIEDRKALTETEAPTSVASTSKTAPTVDEFVAGYRGAKK